MPSISNTTNAQPTSFLTRCYRVILDTLRGFFEDDCYAKASALTFYSLLSIVPVLAVLFGIAKGFGFENALETEIHERFSEQPEVASKLIQFAYSWLHSVQGGLIAGIGSIMLLWSVIGLLNNIESTLNDIWKTKIGRPYTRKISDYLAVMIIAPIFLVTSSSINVYLTTQITATAHSNLITEAVSPLLLFLLKLFPYFLSWFLFIFVYLFMPNTKVYWRSAIMAGILAGTAFQLWQWVYIKFQIGVASYGAIYGSFAALPLFLIWLQISWLILLAGAEIAVQLENDLFVPNRSLNPLPKKAAAMLIVYRCIEAFDKNLPPSTDRILAQELGMSLNHVHSIIESLQTAGILSEVSYSKKTYGYQPARAIQNITTKVVCDAIEKTYEIPASVESSSEMDWINNYLNDIEKTLDKENKPLYPLIP